MALGSYLGSLNGVPPSHHPYRRRGRRPSLFSYLVALLVTAAGAGIVGMVDRAFSFPPFVVFAIAAGTCWLALGLGPALFSLAMGVLASDFLFLPPRYQLSLNRTTAGMAAVYLLCAVLIRVTAYFAQKRASVRGR